MTIKNSHLNENEDMATSRFDCGEWFYCKLWGREQLKASERLPTEHGQQNRPGLQRTVAVWERRDERRGGEEREGRKDKESARSKFLSNIGIRDWGQGSGQEMKCWEEAEVWNETCPSFLWDLTASTLLISNKTMCSPSHHN